MSAWSDVVVAFLSMVLGFCLAMACVTGFSWGCS